MYTHSHSVDLEPVRGACGAIKDSRGEGKKRGSASGCPGTSSKTKKPFSVSICGAVHKLPPRTVAGHTHPSWCWRGLSSEVTHLKGIGDWRNRWGLEGGSRGWGGERRSTGG